ncbi:uncharacterized protein BHQ10_008808 [Talaromyces amestolkiae]|uniref:Vacuolar ATPase assembly protein VMA22 n=1 Tax=Talaromyces amestolkiae TaxID=1196081 RepID=A0A364LAF9_TALAM|nr:uncharacterized protein BHQ10_008808 [Talaromyces amestolkiae]RAO72796.1 hypothetical protein BHQ10_008808 [Talaromyces amestolkiae]
MSQIPTPPQSRGASTEPNEKIDITRDEKVQLLDNLLERYLHLLDTHQKLQESLGKQLSSGFFQLAHANYVSPGRRFGEDFYDERMKATRRLNFTSLLDDEQSDSDRIEARVDRVQFEVEYKSVLDKKDNNEKDKTEDGDEKDAKSSATEIVAGSDNETEQETSASGIATPPTQTQDINRDNDNDKGKDSTVADESTKNSTKKKIFRSDDPISWYGILVPSSLKSAQKSFIEAVDGGIPQIVSVMQDMRCVEDMVYELRKEIEGSTKAE